jgi:general secretion pathway protein A
MDREQITQDWDASESGQVRLLPSRRSALERLRRAAELGAGPVVMTGEAGVGKTWLASRLAESQSVLGGLAWVHLDASPTLDPAGLMRMIADELGIRVEPGTPPDRVLRRLGETLAESAEDGHRWALFLDEAHLASEAVLETVRILSNALGRPDGLGAILLVGQTPLLRRLATRPLTALSARVATRVHLGPIEVEEVPLLIRADLPRSMVERLHRDARGNPGRLVRVSRSAAGSEASRAPRVRASSESQTLAPTVVPATALVPAKPPLRVEDGLIEVGWEGEADPRPESPARVSPADAPAEPAPHQASAATGLGVEEVVDDPYAALQAWAEWSSSQGRGPIEVPSSETDGAPLDLERLRVEGAQSFAPYSQLFSRLKEARRGD